MKALLTIASLALCGVLALQWHDWPPKIDTAPQGSDPHETESPSVEETASPLELLDPPLEKDDFASVIERPLFLPDRRPPSEEPEETEEPAVVEEAPKVALDTMDLNAVIITPSEAVAWVRTPSKPTAEKLHIGDTLDGWTVKAIKGDEVEMERQGKTDTLVLRDYSYSPPPPTRQQRRAARRQASQPKRTARPGGRPGSSSTRSKPQPQRPGRPPVPPK